MGLWIRFDKRTPRPQDSSLSSSSSSSPSMLPEEDVAAKDDKTGTYLSTRIVQSSQYNANDDGYDNDEVQVAINASIWQQFFGIGYYYVADIPVPYESILHSITTTHTSAAAAAAATRSSKHSASRVLLLPSLVPLLPQPRRQGQGQGQPSSDEEEDPQEDQTPEQSVLFERVWIQLCARIAKQQQKQQMALSSICRIRKQVTMVVGITVVCAWAATHPMMLPRLLLSTSQDGSAWLAIFSWLLVTVYAWKRWYSLQSSNQTKTSSASTTTASIPPGSSCVEANDDADADADDVVVMDICQASQYVLDDLGPIFSSLEIDVDLVEDTRRWHPRLIFIRLTQRHQSSLLSSKDIPTTIWTLLWILLLWTLLLLLLLLVHLLRPWNY